MTFERTELLKSFDGTELFFRCITPARKGPHEPPLEGLVLAVHGFAEHSGRYADVARAVCEKRLAFACFDLRGHGNSGPGRGDAENLSAMILDVLFVVNHAQSILGFSQAKPHRFGLFGHSFGALLLTYAAPVLNQSCPPLFLSSPCYAVREKLPAWKVAVARSFIPDLFPKVPVPPGIPLESISNNPENNAAYDVDPLVLQQISTRMGQIFLNSLSPDHVKHAIGLTKAPVTICAGAADKLVDVTATQKFAPLFLTKGSSLQLLEGGGHEIFNELPGPRAAAFSALDAWLDTLTVPSLS